MDKDIPSTVGGISGGPLSVERLRQLLDYRPSLGQLVWKLNLKGGVRAGDVAGCLSQSGSDKKYVRIRVDGVLYHAHRLVWFHQHGEWPRQIDHRDTKAASNALDNLRPCTQSQNLANSVIRADNTSGFKGVSLSRNRHWRVQLGSRYIGSYSTPEEAAKAYDKAALECYGEFARTNKGMGLLS